MQKIMAKPAERAAITVYRGWLDRGKYVWSPFVTKLEARLRFAGVSYIAECGSTSKSPKGKIPYVDLQDSASEHLTMSDSSLIIKQMIEANILPDINARISPEARAHDLAVRALLEDKLVFYHGWERWICNFYAMRDHILAFMPYPLRVLVGMLIYRKITTMLHGQGTGRYTAEEIAAFRLEIWENINNLLVASKSMSRDNQPFWVLKGEHPTEADATVYGFVVSVLLCTAGPDSQAVVKGFPTILEYASRIHDEYFPDYEKW
ncbi:hypothetical protein BP6252_06096 [Coleophoma cylindrospora]|uniref:Thioredoxin-like fold domain-containing protein n=1 Tax=Coleophoma cylindrospora TaxID=1849047 RepID=A0A3D8RM30_9HELO|nr:hypothetical protein BP6252_06096 [Coleophoma cylindrospora]